jgi:pimeloyl-ACP methyl ester carboxylesterase
VNKLLLRSLALWLVLLELLAGLRHWRGLSWRGSAAPHAAALLAAAALHPRGVPWGRRLVALTLSALPALLLQMAAASIRNRRLDPLARLEPGEHADRTVERLDITMAFGHCPALHIVPRDGSEGAVCVLHGSGCDKTYFAWRLASALVERGLAVLLVDLDGHGESPRPQRHPGATEATEIAAAWLRARYRRVGVLGISLGGCIAARAAADGLEVDAVALLETPPHLQFTSADRWREARRLFRPFMFDLLGETTPYRLAYAVYDLVRAQSAPRIAAEISTWELIAALDLVGSLRRIQAPLLLVYGGLDAIVPPTQAELARRAAPGARFVMVPEASHLTLILHPGAVRDTAAWLGETLLGQR